MGLMKRSFLFVAVVSLLVAPLHAAASQPSDYAVGPLFVAAGGSGVFQGQITSEGSGGITAACQWYSIDCVDGTSDSCCGSASSCLSYCEEVCGGPCEQEN